MKIEDALLVEITKIIQSSKDFVLSEAPDIARQIVLMGRIEQSLLLIFNIIGLLAILKWALWVKKQDSYHVEMQWAGLCVIGPILTLTFCFFLMGTISVWLTPKLYILNELRGCSK